MVCPLSVLVNICYICKNLIYTFGYVWLICYICADKLAIYVKFNCLICSIKNIKIFYSASSWIFPAFQDLTIIIIIIPP